MDRSWRQYTILLKKEIWYKRKRKPAVMLLEVIWPVALFAVVILVRQGSLPERKSQCFYKPRSMPSAGALDFLKTHVCNVNNRCLKQELYAHKGKPQGVGGVGNGKPANEPKVLGFTASKETDEIIPLVPKVLQLLEKLSTTISKPEVGEYLSGEGMQVKHLIKNDTEMKSFLIEEDLVPEGLVDELFEAEIILNKQVKNMNARDKESPSIFDLKKELCDPERLGKTIHLPQGYSDSIKRVSQELCTLDHDALATFADLLTRELKTKNITNEVFRGIQALVRYIPDNVVSDLALFLDTLSSLQIFKPLVKALPMLQNLGSLTNNIKNIVVNAKNAKGFNEVVALVVPILGDLLADDELPTEIMIVANGIEGIVEFIGSLTKKSTYKLIDTLDSEYNKVQFQLALNRLNGDQSQINKALNSEVSPVRVRSMSDRLRLGSNWYDLTCASSDNLTTIFKDKSEDLDYMRSLICEQGKINALNSFRPWLDYTKMIATMDRVQRARALNAFDIISIVQDVAGVAAGTVRIAGKITRLIYNFDNITTAIGKQVQEALNIEFETREGVKYGAAEILDLISNIVGKTEEFKSLADAIHLARQIVLAVENDFTQVGAIIKNPAALVPILLGNGLTQEVIDKLLTSKIDLSGLLGLVGVDGKVSETLCTGGQLLNILGLTRNSDFDTDGLVNALCNEGNIADFIDVGKVASEQLRQTIPAYMMYGDWWQETLQDINGVMDGIGALIDVISGRKIFDARVLLKFLYNIVDSLGVTGRADMSKEVPSLLGLIEDIIIKPPYLVDDVYTLSKGILSMSIFTKQVPLAVNMKDYTKNPRAVTEFLQEEAGLSPYVVSLLLRSEFEQVLSYNIKDVSFNGEKLCGPALVRQFLKFKTATDDDLAPLAEKICNLPQEKIMNFVQNVVPRLNMKDLVKNILELSPTYLLSSSNLTEEDTRKFVKQIKPLGSQFSSLITSVKDISDSNATLTSTSALLESYGLKLCGDSGAFAFGNYGASFLSSDRAKKEDQERKGSRPQPKEPTWTPVQLREIAEFDDPICLETYKSINTLPGIGPMLWRFVKPLVRGKVLFTPNTTTTHAIMNEANWLFNSVNGVRDAAQQWISFTDKKKAADEKRTEETGEEPRGLADIIKVLKNPLVSATVLQTTGVSGEELAAGINNTKGITAADLETVTGLAKSVLRFTNCLDYGLEGYDDEIQMEERAQELSETDRLLAGVEFKNMPPQRMDIFGRPINDVNLPKHVEYILRLTIDHVQIRASLFGGIKQAAPEDDFLDDLRYLWGFVALQDLIDHAIIKLQLKGNSNFTVQLPKIDTQAFPYPCYDQDDFMVWASFVIVIILLFSWLCMMAVGITSAVSEKESGVEDTMMVMGMKGSVNRLAWFTNTLLGMIFLSAFVTLLISGGNLVRHSDPILIFVWLSTYSVSIVMLCYLVSALVHRTNLASLFGLLVYLILCLPFIILHSMNVVFGLSFEEKILMSLSVTSAFCFGANELIVTEKNGQGITWATAFRPTGETYPFGWSCIMSLVDCAIYFLIAWFISNKFPGAHGVPQPWYFPFSPYYWGCKKQNSDTYDSSSARHRASAAIEEVPGEEEPRNLPVGISICGLTKVYNDTLNSCVGKLYQKITGKKKLRAVDNLSVNFFEGQITAFLGHNGAGKSTCIHMLTGLITPTGGTAYIGGYNIKDGFDEVRKSLGYCPQHDVLFDYMTIKEHFTFYARMKGHGTSGDAEDEVDSMLRLTGLLKFKNIPVSQLSGGQRRRVSVGNAFIGGSKVIILDEPTSGVDPAARRLIWDIIAKHKEGRTILLCTHHLDEADVLGDRIVIVHQGKLICSGTSLWLKTQYGSGYHLTISKKVTKECESEYDVLTPSNRPNTGGWSSSRVIRVVRDYVPGAYISEEIGTEVTIVLPIKGHATRFQELFVTLEARSRELFVDKYGVADSTLEEVFLKVTRLADEGKSLVPKDTHRRRGHTRYNDRVGDHFDNLAFDGSDLDRTDSLGEITEDDSSIGSPPSNEDMSMDGDRMVRGGIHSMSSGYDTSSTPRDPDRFSSISGSTEGRSMQDVTLVDAADGKLTGRRRTKGMAFTWRQFKALITKRFHHHRRDLRSHVSQIVLPAIFVFLAMMATWFKASPGEYLPYRLDASMYGPDQTVLFSMFNSTPLAEEMVATLKTSPGLGTLCMPVEPLDKYHWVSLERNCSKADHVAEFVEQKLTASERRVYELYPNCSCQSGTWTCPVEAAGPPRPTLRTHTQDRVVNLTGYPMGVEQYILRTYDVFKAVEVGGTFGGWTFDAQGDNTVATVWYNSKGLHSLPAFYNSLNNMALRANIRRATNMDGEEYGITVYNQPYKTKHWPLSINGLMMSFTDTGVSLTIMIAYCFVPASFIIYVINERIHQEKRLQFLTGVGIALYWFSALLWDIITYSITVAITIGISKGFGLHVYTYGQNLQALACMLMLFGWATIPLMYLLSRWFTNPTVGYVAAFIINLCIGINTTASIFFLQVPIFNNRPEIVLARDILTRWMLIFPQFCLGDSLVKLAYNQIITDIMHLFHSDSYTSPFSPDLLFYHFLTLGIEGAIFFAIHLVVEINICETSRRVKRLANYKEDSDVSAERMRVRSGEAEKDVLVLYNLSKVYSRTGLATTLAVDNLCIGVPRAECFGLLGVNGAGKTTSFKMITGEIHPSSGAAMLKGSIISEDISTIKQNVGYCPQFDALDDYLTGEEMIYYYSRLRGIIEQDIPEVCANVVRKFQLERHIKKRVGAYSAGNKRKLSTALALIGEPDLVLLDEPTTGMDPGTRRLVWNNIIEVIKDKRSVILTSHSMEECDALCTRMAIMVNGTFQCMGSGQHLKNKFGSGYTITARVGGNSEDVRRVIRFMHSRFRGAVLKDRHLNMLEFRITSKSTTLAEMFRRLEREKNRLKIENYSVAQTTLDNVFLHFARKQTDNMHSREDREETMSQASFVVDDKDSVIMESADTATLETSTDNEISAPPSYHSHCIAPNSYGNPRIAPTLDNVSQIYGGSSSAGSEAILLSSSSGSQRGDDDMDISVMDGGEGESSTDTGVLGGVESSSSSGGSRRGSVGSRR